MITFERLIEQVSYDRITGIFVWKISKRRVTKGKIAGYTNNYGYHVIQIDGKSYNAGRLAWLYMTGKFPTLQIDHINGNRGDDSWKNLRNISQPINMQNQRNAHSHNISGMLGVGTHNNGFVSEIRLNGKRIYLGFFKTSKAAHAAYINAKRKLHPGCTL